MNKTILLTALILCSAFSTSLFSQENRPKIKVGGQFYLATYYDSYKSVDIREGVTYSFPLPPNLDPGGEDLNKASQLGISVYQTRLNFTASDFRLLNAEGKVYVETDFLGSGNDFLQMLRLRQAYLELKWSRDELLLGQTNNLEFPVEVISGLLTAAAGSPLTVLSRAATIRYGRRLGEQWKAFAAMTYHRIQASSSTVPTTLSANRNSGLPTFEGRIQYGSTDRVFFGIAGAYKTMRPRLETDNGYRASSTIGSGSVTAFLRWNLNGHTFKMQGTYGGNMTHLGMIGGYGKRADDAGDDYGYTNLRTGSLWGDFETRPYRNLRAGIFAGYMENMGSEDAIDPAVIYARSGNLHHTGRVSPRLTWMKDNLLVGLEYSLFWAEWGKAFDDYHVPVESFDTTHNNRVLLLVRYTF